MNIGKLNRRIMIQRFGDTEDENGFNKKDWVDLTGAWASVNNLFGKEFWDAKRDGSENTVKFQIRYQTCKDLTNKDRIIFKNRIFDIIHVDNFKYENKFLIVKAKEV